ncbi:hypothetical protein NQ318_018720 [Aromia moschata]|uniref:Transposase n=1 Tax=Aromia moschata TaxID=1265417 RepID=A0AAV8ZG13_9CUCU|nr:hypothetical protein NQ318_018720 [Aromia moschata]
MTGELFDAIGSETIEILIFIGCGNNTRTQQKVCNLLNAKISRYPITQSTLSKIESKFREIGDIKDLPESGRPKITQDKNIEIVLSMEENPQSTSSTLVASENEVSQTTVLRTLRKKTIIPTNFSLCKNSTKMSPIGDCN